MTHVLFRNAAAHQDGFRDIDPLTLEAHPGQARLIDVREPHEFTGELGHVAEAELVPLATLAEAAKGWDRSADLVIICRSGARSANGARTLVSMGFERVMNLRGGMIAWNHARLPIQQ